MPFLSLTHVARKVGSAATGKFKTFIDRYGFFEYCISCHKEITINVAKCNLGKVNLEAMLVSCYPSYSRGGPMPLAGAPRDLYMQWVAFSSSQSVVAIACCLRASLCFGFSHPSLPLGVGLVSIGSVSIPLNCSV